MKKPTIQKISSQPRYDHFDTSAYIFSISALKSTDNPACSREYLIVYRRNALIIIHYSFAFVNIFATISLNSRANSFPQSPKHLL